MSIVAAGLASAGFAAGDFLGGVAARGSNWRLVVSTALGAGLLVLGAAAVIDGHFIGPLSLTWCLSAAAGFAVGVSLLYRALAGGRMTQVAPITAIVAPSVVDILMGKAVTGRLVLGLGAAGLSAALLSGLSGDWRESIRNHSVIIVAVGAGLGLALFYIGSDRVEAVGGGVRGLLLVRATSFLVSTAGAVKGRGAVFRPRDLGVAVGAGLLDGAANLPLMMAFATGGLAETSAVASLYPVTTILLAMAV